MKLPLATLRKRNTRGVGLKFSLTERLQKDLQNCTIANIDFLT